MDIYENTTIFIACPANYTSGGPELLHQLGSELLRRGLDARMWYYGIKDGRPPQEHVYRKYHVPFVISVDEDDDAPENILLIPESAPGLYGWTKSMRKIFWWMSVDNYFTPLGKTFLMRPKYLFQKAICDTVYLFAPDPQMEHWVQSEYARQFVHMNRVPDTQVHFVGDYLQSAAHLQQMSAGGGTSACTSGHRRLQSEEGAGLHAAAHGGGNRYHMGTNRKHDARGSSRAPHSCKGIY